MTTLRFRSIVSVLALGSIFAAAPAFGHCDTPEGPVVPAVHEALESGSLTPALRWIKPEYEKEVKAAFDRAQTVRKQGGAAGELADAYFADVFVRLHRAGEGEPFTGIKPAGSDPGPVVTAADAAIASGNDDAVITLVTEAITHKIRQQFADVRELRGKADASVADGREFVDAYVKYIHFVDHIHTLAAGKEVGHQEAGRPAAAPHSAHAPAKPAGGHAGH